MPAVPSKSIQPYLKTGKNEVENKYFSNGFDNGQQAMVKARLNVPGLIIFFAKDICHICLNINMLIISRTGYWVQCV